MIRLVGLCLPLFLCLPIRTLIASEGAASESQLFKEGVIEFPRSDTEPDEDLLDEQVRKDCSLSRSPLRYPVVLLHGFMGFDEILQIDYFYRVKQDYQRRCIPVFIPTVSPLDYIHHRAMELAPKIDQILALTGAEKVNLIAHSMGGLDARYLISTLGYGDRVASLTTIGTPHRGSPVPGMVWALLGKGDHVLYRAFEFLVAGATSKGDRDPADMNLHAALSHLTPEYLDHYFNQENPDNPEVYYQSYAGISSLTGLTTGDVMDPLLLAFQVAFLKDGLNDGLVPLSSAKWGRFRGIVRADHIDLIGQLLGTTSLWFNHRKFYKKISEDLLEMGF